MAIEIYKLIQVSGNDAGEFLQGQLTQDIERVPQTGSLPAAWCNPKGRVITLLRIVLIESGFGLVLPASLADSVCERLKIYRLRADVALEVAGSEWVCLIVNSASDLEALGGRELLPEQEINACRIGQGLTAVNIGLEEKCVELLGFRSDIDKAGIDINEPASADFLRGTKIRAGIPEILELHSESFTPHMLNLDLLGAVSFDKGCYTGQEVVARTENLGSSKRRLMRYSTVATLNGGDKLSDGEKDAGEVINVIGNDLLAVTPVEVHDKTLFANGVEVTPETVPYF